MGLLVHQLLLLLLKLLFMYVTVHLITWCKCARHAGWTMIWSATHPVVLRQTQLLSRITCTCLIIINITTRSSGSSSSSVVNTVTERYWLGRSSLLPTKNTRPWSTATPTSLREIIVLLLLLHLVWLIRVFIIGYHCRWDLVIAILRAVTHCTGCRWVYTGPSYRFQSWSSLTRCRCPWCSKVLWVVVRYLSSFSHRRRRQPLCLTSHRQRLQHTTQYLRWNRNEHLEKA